MSAPPLSRIVRFLLIAAGLIIVFSVVWAFIDSAYSDFLAWIARSVVSEGAQVEHREGTIYFAHIVSSDSGWRPVSDSIEASAIQFGVLLAVALVAATPGLKLWQRLAYGAIALAITFVLQVLSVLIMARTFNNLFFVIVSDVIPPVLWAIFSFKYWFAAPQPAVARQGEPLPVMVHSREKPEDREDANALKSEAAGPPADTKPAKKSKHKSKKR